MHLLASRAGEFMTPELAKCNGDARPNERFDGLSYERWIALREIASKLELPEWLALLNFARELERGGESARTIGLAEALGEVDAVIAANQSKHQGKKWLTQTALYHLGKHQSHLGRALSGEWLDNGAGGSGRPHLAHSIARLAMFFSLELKERERR